MTKQQQAINEIYKVADLQKWINDKVRAYMEKGWMLCWAEQGGTYLPRYDMDKANERIRIFAEIDYYGEFRDEAIVLTVQKVSPDGYQDYEVIERTEYYQLCGHRGIYTTDLTACKQCRELSLKRYYARATSKAIEIKPNNQIIKLLKNHKGFKSATKNNVTITHDYRVNAYYITNESGKRIYFKFPGFQK